jgi:hypothetical protein
MDIIISKRVAILILLEEYLKRNWLSIGKMSIFGVTLTPFVKLTV